MKIYFQEELTKAEDKRRKEEIALISVDGKEGRALVKVLEAGLETKKFRKNTVAHRVATAVCDFLAVY